MSVNPRKPEQLYGGEEDDLSEFAPQFLLKFRLASGCKAGVRHTLPAAVSWACCRLERGWEPLGVASNHLRRKLNWPLSKMAPGLFRSPAGGLNGTIHKPPLHPLLHSTGVLLCGGLRGGQQSCVYSFQLPLPCSESRLAESITCLLLVLHWSSLFALPWASILQIIPCFCWPSCLLLPFFALLYYSILTPNLREALCCSLLRHVPRSLNFSSFK